MQYVIIGCSAAGISAIEAIRAKDKDSKIIVITDEKNPLYSRCLISYLLAGTIDENKIWYRPGSFFKDNKVKALLGIRAKEINIRKKEITLSNYAGEGFKSSPTHGGQVCREHCPTGRSVGTTRTARLRAQCHAPGFGS